MKLFIKIILMFFICIIPINSQSIGANHDCDYLIITPDIFMQSSNTWSNNLYNLQVERGFHPSILTISPTTSNSDIRHDIEDYYNNNSRNLRYVLLVGSGKNYDINRPEDEEYDVQFRQHGVVNEEVDYFSGTYIPFFSVYCQDDWNPNGVNVASDDPYIEGLTSRGPLYIGRVPVVSTIEMNNYVDKLMSYYSNFSSYSSSKNREILLNLDINGTNGCSGELIRQIDAETKQHIPSTVDIIDLKSSQFPNCNPFTYSYCYETSSAFEQAINPGASIITIIGTHGGPKSLGGFYAYNSLFNLTNKQTSLPFLFAPNCSQGEVNNPTSESVVRKLITFNNGGIIGAIAPTHNSGQYANRYVLNRFHDIIYGKEVKTYGEITAILKNELLNNYNNLQFYYKSIICFGDPSMLPSNYKHWTGTSFTVSATWAGNIIVDNSTTIQPPCTMTLLPGTNLFLKDNASITVLGRLVANALGNIPITIQPTVTLPTASTITFSGNSSTSSLLRNVTAQNIDRIECLSNANITIDGCKIINSIHGLYLSNAQPTITNNIIENPQQNGIYGTASGYSPTITGNLITKSVNPYNYQGIYLSGCTPLIMNNTINGFYWGAYIGGGCVAQTGYDLYFDCNNNITNNLYGLGTAWGSQTIAGQDDGTGSGNSISGNTYYDIYTYNSSYFTGFFDYFGTDPNIYGDMPEANDIGSFLSDNPCDLKNRSINLSNNNIKDNPNDENFIMGLRLEKGGKIDEAIDFYKKLIFKDIFVSSSLTELLSIRMKYSRLDITEYFNVILGSHNKHFGKLKNILGDIYLQSGQFDQAITSYNDAILNSPTEYDGINARFDKLFAYLHEKNDIIIASNILTELKAMNLSDHEYLIRLKMAEDLIEGSKNKLNKKGDSGSIPDDYSLSQNFPNPFNPSTIIRYQLSVPGFTTLKVYDILGKEISTLVNEKKDVGSYEVKFDASKYASGVYIYQLKVNDCIINKKMIFAK